MQMNEFKDKVQIFLANIQNAYKDEENKETPGILRLPEGNEDEDFIALIHAFYLFYKERTGCEEDIVAFPDIINKLIWQHLFEMQKKADEGH